MINSITSFNLNISANSNIKAKNSFNNIKTHSDKLVLSFKGENSLINLDKELWEKYRNSKFAGQYKTISDGNPFNQIKTKISMLPLPTARNHRVLLVQHKSGGESFIRVTNNGEIVGINDPNSLNIANSVFSTPKKRIIPTEITPENAKLLLEYSIAKALKDTREKQLKEAYKTKFGK